jgi:hypothetical protein
MDKSNPPTSFGVFKPVDHIVMSLKSEPLAQSVTAKLLEEGFSRDDLTHYTPQEMIHQVEAQVITASPLASVGQDLNLILAHRALAEQGCSFLVVHAPDAEQIERVRVVANAMGATTAQRYGSLIVEELVDPQAENRQVFESPDRGLDVDAAAVRSS